MKPTLRLLAPLLALCVVAVVVSAFFVASGSRPELDAQAGGIKLDLVARGLANPTYVSVAPGEPGRLYVVEQAGRVRVIENGKLLEQPFLNVAGEVKSGGEQGLLSIAFHPDYRRNGLFYVDYTDRNGDTRVVEYQTADGRPPALTRQLLFIDDPYPNHNGGQLAFGPDGLLYVGMGDGGGRGDPENRAQDLGSRFGKLLTIDVAVDEPEPMIAAYGLRNPWRFSFDRATDDLWIADVGQNSWEEVNVLPAGTTELVNFGWDVREGLVPFEDKPVNEAGRLVDPVAVYNHSQGCSITGGFVYRGTELPELAGRFLYGDYCSGSIWSLELAPDGRTADVRREGITVPGLTTFGEDEEGRLYLASEDGSIYRLSA